MSKHSKEDILKKGSEILRTRGYTNTGIEVILKECSIPKGSFYNFFKNKEEFGVMAIDSYGEEQKQWMSKLLLDNDLGPMERLKQFYNQVIGFHISEDCKNGCLIGNMAQEMGGLSQNLADAVKRNFAQVVVLLVKVISEGQKLGEIRNDYSAKDLANYMQNSFYGAIMRGKSEGSADSFTLYSKMTFDFITKK